LPLDPTYPAERLRFMLEDCRAPILVTCRQLLPRLPERQAHVVCLDDAWEAPTEEPAEAPAAEVGPDNLAYVSYTSGSTGRPKGVVLSHRALANLIQWHCAELPRGRRVLQFSSLSFDASFHEIFAAWCLGGTLFVIPECVRQDPRELARYLSQE